MTQVSVLEARRDTSGGYKVDVGRGKRIGRVSSEWFSRPADERYLSLSELARAVRDRADRSRTRVVESALIHVEANRSDPERLALILPGTDTPVAPTHWSFGQLASLVGAPAAYLRQLPAPLAAINLQYGLTSNRAEQIKTLETDDGRTELRAVTGPDYGRIFDVELVEAVQRIAGNGTGDTRWKVPGVLDWSTSIYNPRIDITKDTTTLYASDRDVFLFLVDDLNPIEAGRLPDGSPDLYFRGFYCWNSEVGAKTLGMASFYLRAVCQNRNLWGVEDFEEITIRHSKYAANRFAHEAAPALANFANSSPLPFVNGIKAARERIVARSDEDPPDIRLGDDELVEGNAARRRQGDFLRSSSHGNILHDGRPRDSLSTSNPSRSEAPPSSSKGGSATNRQPERHGSAKPETRKTGSPALRMSGGSIEHFLRLGLHVEAGVLMRLVARDGGDALREIEDALGRPSFLGQHRVDDLAGLGLGEAATTQEVGAIKAGVSIEELAEDIARRTLLQSITVRPVRDADGNETGMFEIPAGGRRYRALELLVKQKRLAKNAPVPCVIREGGMAEEDSLAENIQRAPLHPLDQFRAFLTFREKGMSEEEIAANQFVSVSVVKQRLRLASVSPKLLDVYAADGMTLDQLMAFTVNGDHERQEQVFERLAQGYSKEPHLIRRMLTEGAVRAADKRAQFVGLEAYAEAGGVIMHDLFQGDDGGWLQDVGLLDMLVAEKLREQSEAISSEGWKWIDVAPDFPYGHTYGLRHLRGEQPPLTEEEQATRDALKSELDGLEEAYADAEDLPDEVDERLGEIETAISALDDRPMVFDPEEIARAGAFVSIDGSGNLRVERGYVRPEDEQPIEPEVDSEIEDGVSTISAPVEHGDDHLTADIEAGAEPEEDDGLKPIPDRLMTELTAHRTLALRHALGEQPDVAFLAALHALTLRAFYHYGSDTCLELDLKSVSFGAQAPGLNDSSLASAVDGRHQTWVAALPKEPGDLWEALQGFDGDSRYALFAHCVSLSVNAIYEAYNRRPRALAHADQLAQAVDLDMVAAGWEPTIDTYLGRVTKARILASVREAKGTRAGDRIEHLKKGDMAEKAQELLAGSGWLPEPLRTPGHLVTAVDDASAVETGQSGDREVEDTAEDGGETAMAETEPQLEDEPAEIDMHVIAAE